MKRLVSWVGATAILVVIFGTIYTVVQQQQRSDANYPQIQMAEDVAASLNQGANPTSLTGSKVDLSTSLSSFVIIYNRSGQLVSGDGYLDGVVLTAPYGILQHATSGGHTVTWQPASNVRIAAVTVPAQNYYVLSGRSLKQVEINETHTLQLSFLGGVLALIILAGMFIISQPRAKTLRKR